MNGSLRAKDDGEADYFAGAPKGHGRKNGLPSGNFRLICDNPWRD
jgi:hypothetical protein